MIIGLNCYLNTFRIMDSAESNNAITVYSSVLRNRKNVELNI